MTCGGVCVVSGVSVRLEVMSKWSEVCSGVTKVASGAVACVDEVQLVT